MVAIINIIFCLSFLVFAYLNLNDVDPWLWVPIYLSAAVCCGLVVFHQVYPKLYLCLIAIYLVHACIIYFSKDGVRDWITKYNKPSLVETMQADKPYIEKTREFFGLLIIAGALLINYIVA